jgi:phenylalanyl-tRNA synthetase alpha chain
VLRKGIPDITLLRSPDARVAEQMLDLEPYRPVAGERPVRLEASTVAS